MWKPTHAKRLPSRWQTAVGQQVNDGGNRRRSGTGISSFVAGSQISERAVTQEPAVSDGQDDWTVVKKIRKGRRNTEKQSEMLTEDSQAKTEPRALLQQTKTETQPAEPSGTT